MRSIGAGIKDFIDRQLDLIEELRNHQFFQSLKDTDWSQYQVGPIVVSSILINLLELSSPIYINLVYTTVLPTKAFASLTLLTIGVVVLLSVSGWLRTVRTGLTGFDGARVEHQRRMEALAHFTQMRLGDYLKEPPPPTPSGSTASTCCGMKAPSRPSPRPSTCAFPCFSCWCCS
ncbi:hypothetical protein [Cyanobium sp. ATX-6F1]|uniref:hypothetical protein n=1 Tax=Cyanobium sp. ATX-6F1 TaxID=3137388 RepID=UPI0039BE7499